MKRSKEIGEIVYWHCAAIQQDPSWLAWCMGVLSQDELARSTQYASRGELAVHYQASRGELRYLLSQYTKVPAHRLHFIQGIFGKPTLLPHHCSFNFSDSKPYWAVAVHPCAHIDIGVDIETIERFRNNGSHLTPYILSFQEQANWNANPPHCAYTALAKVWSRKEALLKAVGVGLHRSMRDISIGWCGSSITIKFPDIRDRPTMWSVHDLSPLPPGLVGALALRGHGIAHPLSLPFPEKNIDGTSNL